MSQHRLAPRPTTLRRTVRDTVGRPRVRRTLQLGAIAALVAASVTSVPSSAQASPEQVLQSVAVSVAPDGTISTINSSTLAKGDGDTSSKVTSIDPATAASSLPVRVLTSYVLGHQTGTDLDDIVGKAGTVTINVSVQNTTVRPEKVSYNSGGVQKSQYALVGAPFTVVGSATLGKGDLGRVVTVDAAHPTQVTSGVLSQTTDGTAHVQWAAMLAPPRLPASTTFTLVEKTAKFSVPEFDFNVQPGLDTDTSMQALVDQAFSDDGSTQQLESKTISLIGNVNSVLAEAGVQLNQIQGNLDSSSDSLGVHTIADLQSGRQQVTDHLTSVIADLQRLRDDISTKLHDSQSSVLASLDKSLQGVIATVGTPSQPMPKLTTADENCAATVPVVAGSDAGLSVLQQLRVVGAQLNAIRASMPACRAQIEQSLVATIGDASQGCPPSGALSAICTLRAASTDLGHQSEGIGNLSLILQGDASPAGLGETDLDSAITTLKSQSATVQQDVAKLVHPGGGLDGVDSETDTVDQQLSDLKASLSNEAGTLSTLSQGVAGLRLTSGGSSTALDAIKGIAQEYDGSGSTPDPVASALGALATQIDQLCVAPLTCSSSDLLSGLEGALSGEQHDWSTVESKVDDVDGQLGGLASAIDDVSAKIGTLQDDVDGTLQDDVDGTLQHDVDGIADSNAAVRADLETLRHDAGDLGDQSSGTVSSVSSDFDQVKTKTQALGSTLSTGIAQLQSDLANTQQELGDSVTATDDARANAQTAVGNSISSLSQALASSRGQLLTKGQQRLSDARGDLSASGAQAATSLGKATDAVVQNIATSVASANTNLSGTSQQLSGDLAKVLTDIGTRQAGGTGILGTLATSAATAGVSSHNIAQVSQTADDFRHVRSAELDNVYLQQQQTDAALELQQQLPPFAITLPAGSHVLTVYSFHLAG